MCWFVVIWAIAFLILGPNDSQLKLSAANVLMGAAGHIDSSVGISGDVEGDAEPTTKPMPIQKKKGTRQYISAFTKRKVAASQGWRCACCNKKLSPLYELDHIVPLWQSGDNTINNLQALNPECHMEQTIRENSTLK